jgi:hypothetical protein
LQELVTLIWSLAKLHHQPCPEWLAIFFEATESQLPALYGNQLAEMMWALAQLQISPPPDWLDAFLNKVCVMAATCLALSFASSAACNCYNCCNCVFATTHMYVVIVRFLCKGQAQNVG